MKPLLKDEKLVKANFVWSVLTSSVSVYLTDTSNTPLEEKFYPRTAIENKYETVREVFADYKYEWMLEENGDQWFSGFHHTGEPDIRSMTNMPTVIRNLSISFVAGAKSYFSHMNLSADRHPVVYLASILRHESLIYFTQTKKIQ